VSDLLDAALTYAVRAWPVLPVHSIVNGRCTCGKPDCRTPGKHPLLTNGRDGASTDPEVIRAWWSRWRKANIGILTGGESGLLVLDVDYRAGGSESLADLLHEHGPLPDTPEALTGNGRHLYFSWPDGARSGNIGLGLDVKGSGGYAVAPPSLHACGRRYEWESAAHPDDGPLAEPPAWARAGRAPRERLDVGAVLADLKPGNRNDGFSRLTGRLHHAGLSPEDILLLLGPYAERCGFDPEELRAEVEGITGRYAQPAEAARAAGQPAWEGVRVG
jgi:hypothetical protein